ncbi:hypothetical protein FRC12_013667 [Ceratobasidium sp. 428]|nr:hypothetical protein FRC12_013667 [Ceratobasidium sp. 428]
MSWNSDLSSYEDDLPVKTSEIHNVLDDLDWPSATLAALEAELNDSSVPNTQDLLLCDAVSLDLLRAHQLDSGSIRSKLPLGKQWRRLYTDSILLNALDNLAAHIGREEPRGPEGVAGPKPDLTKWDHLIGLLDLVIILAGAPGEGRLELVHSCIAHIQHNCLPLTLSEIQPSPVKSGKSSSAPETTLLPSPVPKVDPPPSFSAFPSVAQRPFILPGFAKDWPAAELWKSKSYLLACSGRGRVVPIERGGDYRKADWGVDVMSWDSFLTAIGWGEGSIDPTKDTEKLYLAQHSLFTQFPKLRADILVPDYVYTTPSAQSGAYSGSPGNDEQLVINAWCGGQGANSPAHTDPYYNIYVQVVGCKQIWLAPPEATPGMYAFSVGHNSNLADQKDNRDTDQDPKREGMLGNTSSVDVFALSTPESNSNSYPLFVEAALRLAQSTTLGPGDVLVIPPGWWHAMRGVGGSFSVSFWF